MLKKIILFCFLITVSFIYGQTITVSGKVLDSDNEPAPGTYYFLSSSKNKKKITNKNGRYSIQYNIGSLDTIQFKNIGFENYSLVITKKMLRKSNGGDIIFDISLSERMTDVVTVFANVPDTVFGTQQYSVADFEFDNIGRLILLTYDKKLDKGSVLRLLDENKKIIDSYYIQGEALELRSDFRNNTHLIKKDQIFLVEVKNNQLHLYLENKEYFFKYVAPIVDTIDNRIYYSNYSEIYPAFDYLEFNREDSTFKTMLKVKDEPMMVMYRSEFKYVDVRTKLWAANKQLETGIDKEIWVGASVFTNSLYYEPLYAPLFVSGKDSVFVFDHYKNLLFKYSPESGFSDSISIDYHKDARKSGWEQPLIQDIENDKIYSVFLKNGYTFLYEIDTNSGEIKNRFRLHYKYIEEIQIINGYVYYIYRPFESIQKKYLYKEKLGIK